MITAEGQLWSAPASPEQPCGGWTLNCTLSAAAPFIGLGLFTGNGTDLYALTRDGEIWQAVSYNCDWGPVCRIEDTVGIPEGQVRESSWGEIKTSAWK